MVGEVKSGAVEVANKAETYFYSGHTLVEIQINGAQVVTQLNDALGGANALQEAVGIEFILNASLGQQRPGSLGSKWTQDVPK